MGEYAYLNDVTVPRDPTTALMVATKQYADAKVAKTGDTMSGDLTIDRAGAALHLKSPSTSNPRIRAYRDGLLRWLIAPANGQAESTGNAGSNFDINGYADDGTTLLGTALRFTRSTLLGTVYGDPVAPLGIATKQYSDNTGPLGGGRGTFTSTTLPTAAQTTLALAQAYLSGLTLASNQLTVTKAGWWAASCRVSLNGSVGTGRAFTSVEMRGQGWRQPYGASETFGSGTAMAYLAVNDVIAFSVYHAVGSSLTAVGDWHVKYLGNE